MIWLETKKDNEHTLMLYDFNGHIKACICCKWYNRHIISYQELDNVVFGASDSKNKLDPFGKHRNI